MPTLEMPPSPGRTSPPGPPPSSHPPRRRRRTVLLVLGAVVAGLLLVPIAANAAVTTFAAHDHGTLDITIDGDTVDLNQPRFHDLHPQFHVHVGRVNLWHHHPETLAGIFDFEPLTLRQALAVIGLDLTDGGLALDGSIYDTAEAAVTVAVRVNGTEVDSDDHIIGDGDRIRVDVVTSG